MLIMATEIQLLLMTGKLLHTYWGMSLIGAEVEEGFTRTEKQLVSHWATSPSAKSKNHVKFVKGTYIPEDKELEKLERKFSKYVSVDDVLNATKMFVSIEKRIKDML
jgi:hypothetical protein